MSTIGKFFARIPNEKFAAEITREIDQNIFPHMNGQADHDYPFLTKKELYKARLDGSSKLRTRLCDLDSATLKLNMPEVECNAFLYLAYRDIEERIRLYLQLVRVQKHDYASQSLQPAAVAA